MESKKRIILPIVLTAVVTFVVTAVLGSAIFLFGISSIYKNEKLALVESMIEEYSLFGVDNEEMVDFAAMGIAASVGDPYTAYYPAEEFKAYTDQVKSSYVGVGVTIGADIEKNEIEVISVTEGGPADKAGIRSGDIIRGVDGKTYEASRMTEATMYIKSGEIGTSVTITVERDGKSFDLEVMRDKIDIKSVSSKVMKNDIGYIKISSFNGVWEDEDKGTYEEFCEHFDGIKAIGAKKLIIDLRDNPGGDFNEVCNIVDEFVPEGIITYTEDKNGKRETVYSDKEEVNMPIVVLVNGSSASASEILTGALKDYKKATVIGTQTYGKGIVQRLFPFPDGSGISITVSKYFTPNGECIHEVGIEPDIIVELESEKPLSEIEESEDNQLQAAIEYLSK